MALVSVASNSQQIALAAETKQYNVLFFLPTTLPSGTMKNTVGILERKKRLINPIKLSELY